MTAVRQTSIDAHEDTAYSRGLQREQIMNALISSGENQINTRRELAKKLGLETSTVAGRVNELIKARKAAAAARLEGFMLGQRGVDQRAIGA